MAPGWPLPKMHISLSSLRDNIRLLSTTTTKTSRYGVRHSRKAEWEKIDNAAASLLPQLQNMFWNGVERELRDIIATLKAWEHPDLQDIVLDDEKDNDIYGYDTFIDQVNESSRDFAVLYCEQPTLNCLRQNLIRIVREKAARLQRTVYGEMFPKETALQDIARKFLANEQSRKLKEEIRIGLENLPREPNLKRRRVRMLLQSAGWLDVDKMIEHRPPIDEVGFWKRPMPPQLKLDRLDGDSMPHFVPQSCLICAKVIRESMFECTTQGCKDVGRGYICQDCQHEEQHPKHHHLTKHYKHCILADVLDPATTRGICRCGYVDRIDSDGNLRPLFPVALTDKHRVTKGGAVQCGLLTLGHIVAVAKYEATQSRIGKRTLDEERRRGEAQARKKKTPETIATGTINEKEADADIPFFVRDITDGYPFGNVHMALRLGPVLIENGVEHTEGGALITSRDPPIWQNTSSSESSIAYSLALSADREVMRQNRERHPRRWKAALKQVVGGLFSGFTQSALESEIIDLVIVASELDLDDPADHIEAREALWTTALKPILTKLSTLMKHRVDTMLSSVATNLLDTAIPLKWNRTTNNCQTFCSNLLSTSLYGPFLSRQTPLQEFLKVEPSYLLSFVCRPGSYKRERKIQTKFDVPSGLCEEYLLKFRYGLHVGSDIIDSLQEYWYDWGAFGGPLYRYQDLFPWDCTEAYGRCAVMCSNCNIAKHVWSFPFDSWSMISLHLTRPRLLYPEVQSRQDWMRNRLHVLVAQDALLMAARVMASSDTFRASTAWLTDHPDVRIDRLKLGGIHRAQPFSHQYEEGHYHEYFIASWAHLRREDQIKEYEAIRNKRSALPDLVLGKGTSFERDGCDDGGGVDGMLDVWMMGVVFGDYYSDGWDGQYTAAETMSAADADLVGTTDYAAISDAFGGDGGDGGGCGGCGGD